MVACEIHSTYAQILAVQARQILCNKTFAHTSLFHTSFIDILQILPESAVRKEFLADKPYCLDTMTDITSNLHFSKSLNQRVPESWSLFYIL